MRSITLSVYSRNKYNCSDVMVTITPKNPSKVTWPFEWRFISAASQSRILHLMELYQPVASISVFPLEDNWYCSNQDQTIIQYIIESEDSHD